MSNLAEMRLGAGEGDPRAQVALAYQLLLGRPGPEQQRDALLWLQKACAQNHADGFLFHATLAAIGLGRPQNLDEAHALLVRAAELGNVRAQAQLPLLGGTERFDRASWSTAPEVTQHFDAPRIFTLKNFVPKPVCDWLIGQVQNTMQPAGVFDAAAGIPGDKGARMSSASSFHSLEPDLIVQLVNLRIAEITGLPLPNQEPTQMLHYAPGQQYRPHYDFFVGDPQLDHYASEIETTGQRIGTFLIYLNEDYEGGETEFPRLNWRFKGKTGDALLFWNASLANEFEKDSLHAGLPVTTGGKWLLSKWIRNRFASLT